MSQCGICQVYTRTASHAAAQVMERGIHTTHPPSNSSSSLKGIFSINVGTLQLASVQSGMAAGLWVHSPASIYPSAESA